MAVGIGLGVALLVTTMSQADDALEGLGGAALRGGRVVLDGTGVQMMGRQEAVNRGQAESAGPKSTESPQWRC